MDDRKPDPDQKVAYARMKKAFHNGDVKAFDEAMQEGDNPFYRHFDGEGMLHYVIKQGTGSVPALLERVLSYGVPVDMRRKDGETPLLAAVVKDDAASIRCLINNGADVNAQLDNGFSVFHMQAPESPPTIAKLFYRNGANPDLLNKDGQTAQEYFASKGQGYVLQEFEQWREQQDALALPLQANKPATDIITPDGLFARDNVSMASWNALPDLLSQAKADKLQLDPEGVANMVLNASNHGVLPKVMQALNDNGYRFDAGAMADKTQTPSNALLRIGQNWDLSQVFSPQNMRGQSGELLHNAYRALPPEYQLQVPNIHQLRVLCNEQSHDRGR